MANLTGPSSGEDAKATESPETAPPEEMARRIREFDWAKTPLGPMGHWPLSLRAAVNILLSSRYAMWMAWGPEFTMLYNDAYRPTLGLKHPLAVGTAANVVWAEIWSDIGPRIETVMTKGKATYEEGLLLFLERSGFPEETYHTFSYSPLADDEGLIKGMLCVVTEETDRLIGERRVGTLHGVASALAETKDEDGFFNALREQLNRNGKDLPFTLTYLFEPDGAARLACASGIARDHPLAPDRIDALSDSPWPANQLLKRPVPQFIENLSDKYALNKGSMEALIAGDWKQLVKQVAIVPINRQGQDAPAGFFVVGTSPYRRYDAAYSGFVNLLSGQIAAGLGNARAHEAERLRAEALAELDRAKTTFFSNVSHELRTPLTLLLGPVEELLGSGESVYRPEERELLEVVHRSALRLQKLVNTLLDFSRIEAGRMRAVFEATDLSHLTLELASNFSSAMERAGLNFSIRCRPLPEQVYVDREMWEKIVLNLVSNALKFTFEGSVLVSLEADADSAVLTVGDTGTGIPASELPHIFERFHRVIGAKGRSVEGTGIGLALVHELVTMHGGSIAVNSEVAAGTTFTVRIPLGAGHLPAQNLRLPEEPTASDSRSEPFIVEASRWLPMNGAGADHRGSGANGEVRERILLADDNTDMRTYVTRLLGGSYDVTAVPNGDEALRAALSDPPDLILSDVMMPGLDGFELLRELRAHPETRTVPVILLSARAGEESSVDGLTAGADDYLIKPFTVRELLARVAAHLSMRRRRSVAENALKESRTTLQSFYDSSPFLMGVVEIVGDEIISVYRNSAAADFFQSDLESPEIPRSVDELWVRHYRQSQAEGCAVRFEYEHLRQTGDRWLNTWVNFLGFGSKGQPRFSFIAEDVTERKAGDALLRRSNEELSRANAELEQFAYSASHDLQEPLRQIAVYGQLLERRYADRLEGKASEYLAYCIEGAHRMELMISDLLAYSQVTRTDLPAQSVDIAEVLETVKRNLSTAIGETGAEITAAWLPVLKGDAVPMVHLFQNLISNALKYRSSESPRIHIGALEKEGRWRFSVQDNGIGIAREFQSQIFGIFKRLHDRTEYPGTGIGLAICQKIVEKYGGNIWVASEPGRGSTFFFTLPREYNAN